MNFFHEIFARFGVPDPIVSDNWTQFTSSWFKIFFIPYKYNTSRSLRITQDRTDRRNAFGYIQKGS